MSESNFGDPVYKEMYKRYWEAITLKPYVRQNPKDDYIHKVHFLPTFEPGKDNSKPINSQDSLLEQRVEDHPLFRKPEVLYDSSAGKKYKTLPELLFGTKDDYN